MPVRKTYLFVAIAMVLDPVGALFVFAGRRPPWRRR